MPGGLPSRESFVELVFLTLRRLLRRQKASLGELNFQPGPTPIPPYERGLFNRPSELPQFIHPVGVPWKRMTFQYPGESKTLRRRHIFRAPFLISQLRCESIDLEFPINASRESAARFFASSSFSDRVRRSSASSTARFSNIALSEF